ncbi:MAG: hypothetical protein ABSG13_27680 [Bryobacteraceae bacterium]
MYIRRWFTVLLTGGMMLASPAYSQWAIYKTKNIPRSPDGKPNLSAHAPKEADGKPDLSGMWLIAGPPGEELDGLEHPPPMVAVNLTSGLKPGDVEMLPPFAALFAQRLAARGAKVSCAPPGLPLSFTIPVPFKIIQTPGLITMLYEYPNTYRQIFIDGRALPEDPSPSYLGYSVGKWDGNTLIVETNGFNDKTQLDLMGHPHSESLHMTERYHRRDFGHMDIDITIDDPKAYKKPWTAKTGVELYPDTDLLEFICDENERDFSHLAGK